MGGRRRLKADAPRMLGKHDGADGRAYRRAWTALVGDFGQPARGSLLRLEMGRVATAWALLEAATRRLADARRLRDEGKGRRPSSRDVERAARRQGLADASYSQALEKLRELASERGNGAGDPLADVRRAVAEANR